MAQIISEIQNLDDIKFLKSIIRDIPNFPKKGILFRDITPILQNPIALNVIDEHFKELAKIYADVTAIVAIESRGFIFGTMLARIMNLPLILIRKKDKLPYLTHISWANSEYSDSQLEIHIDSLSNKDIVVIVDDVFALGGTFKAARHLCEKTGARIKDCWSLIDLNINENLKFKVTSLIKY